MLCTIILICKIYLTGCLTVFAMTTVPLWDKLFRHRGIDWAWMIPAILYSLGSWLSFVSFVSGLVEDIKKAPND